MEDHNIQDEEVTELMAWLPHMRLGLIVESKLRHLLQELLTLRRKMRNDANI